MQNISQINETIIRIFTDAQDVIFKNPIFGPTDLLHKSRIAAQKYKFSNRNPLFGLHSNKFHKNKPLNINIYEIQHQF